MGSAGSESEASQLSWEQASVLLSLYKMMKILLVVMLVASATSRSRFGHSCDCQYFSGGCRITTAPTSPTYSCRCTYHGFWTCSGVPVECSEQYFDSYDWDQPLGQPGTSYEHCLQGRGDCGGY